MSSARWPVGVPMRDDVYITRLLVHDGRVFGAYGFDVNDGSRWLIVADAVVLAAGGHTRIWRRSSSRRDENTGDAMRLPWRRDAGCATWSSCSSTRPAWSIRRSRPARSSPRRCAARAGSCETVSASGSWSATTPSGIELSTRDRVALANYTEIAEGRGTEHGGVLLDISHLDRDLILERLPRMYRQFLDLAMLDISTTPMEVAPTAHYSMGGVRVDARDPCDRRRRALRRWRVRGGVHGANRLGGNSLAECLVFGRIVGAEAGRASAELDVQVRDRAAIDEARDGGRRDALRRGARSTCGRSSVRSATS